jgi:hypothetical protein
MQRNSWLGWDHLGMVHEARGDTRPAADCYRKVIDFISSAGIPTTTTPVLVGARVTAGDL